MSSYPDIEAIRALQAKFMKKDGVTDKRAESITLNVFEGRSSYTRRSLTHGYYSKAKSVITRMGGGVPNAAVQRVVEALEKWRKENVL